MGDTRSDPEISGVPFFRYPHVFEQHREELTNAFLQVAGAGAFILQDDVRSFEKDLAKFCGVARAVGVGNATDGLELIVRALELQPGDEVILSGHTFVATAAALVRAGCVPVFAEIGEDHLLDPEDVARRIGSRTRAILPTQLNGRTADMDAFAELAEEHGLLLLEDSAQGLGSRFRGRMAGTFSRAGMYSFYPAKTLGALGDAGAIVTDDEQLADRLAAMRDHGREMHGGSVKLWGRNTRLDNLQAAFLNVKLRHIEEELATRRRLAARYHRGLEGLVQVVRPPYDDDPRHFDVFQNYEVEVEDRDALRRYLATKNVGTILQWGGKGVHQFEALGAFPPMPVTDRALARSMLLPMNTSLTDEEVDYVVRCIREFYGEHD